MQNQQHPTTVFDLVKAVADAGGSLTASEGAYQEPELLGLVRVVYSGAAADAFESVTLTNNGRRLLGMDVETPEARRSLRSRILAAVGLRQLGR